MNIFSSAHVPYLVCARFVDSMCCFLQCCVHDEDTQVSSAFLQWLNNNGHERFGSDVSELNIPYFCAQTM